VNPAGWPALRADESLEMNGLVATPSPDAPLALDPLCRRLAVALTGAILLASSAALFPRAVSAQTMRAVDPSLYAGLRWRSIGPYRGGRAVAVSGVRGDPRTFYFGAVGGGVWKSENAGRTWAPIMDGQPVASIGAIAVAPSDPTTVYVGSGEADMRSDIIHGNGMYRSTDAGVTWTRIGLEDSRQIGRIVVDPRDPKTLLVAALGHAYGPNDMRGVYRSTDGGATWARTLFHDRDTGAIDMASDPSMRTVFASLWQTRRPPWSIYAPSNGPGSGLYKSLDGGVTWNAVKAGGFPTEELGKIGLTVAQSDPKRVYALVDAKAGGLYRSDDGGVTWRLVDKDKRLWQRGWYFCHVTVDPRNPDVVYVSNTAFYRSTDGGEHFTAIKGSPDGDDFHHLWIDPSDPTRMLLGSDQGATVSVDGGRTWGSWFNQPTGQFYRVATDSAFPYRVYGSQQDSGAAAILSRSDRRGIQERDWRPISAGGESDMIAPDPLDRDVIYGGRVDREDFRSNQTRSLSPVVGRPGEWRSEWTMPLAFGPDRALYASQQSIFRSRDGGNRWEAVSGDLSRREPSAGERRGLVYALAPSPLRANVVWAGTDDGLVYLTIDDARTWKNVTPPGITPWSHVDTIEASHFDPRVAYVAIDRHRLDDDRPYVYATRDGGRTWRSATAGIPESSFVYAVREDPARRGLLYAATETGVFVSFDDAASWLSLRLNMPVVSVRDISVRDGDLAIATHGRAFWILDDVAPLRELAANSTSGARLFAPRDAIRTRPGSDEAEASPPETPLGENPPNGAFIDYIVPPTAHGPLTLEIVDAGGRTIRRWSSADTPKTPDPNDFDFPAYWVEQPQRLSAEAGTHRFVWDFHTSRPDGPLAPPGTYGVRMTLDGRTHASRLALRRDPRVRATDAGLRLQATLAVEIDALLQRVNAALEAAGKQDVKPNAAAAPLRDAAMLLSDLETSVESADAAPTANETAAWRRLRTQTERALTAWHAQHP
jgi:photosystem II stability/assembly factor-like uncharacterized protein